MLDVLALSNSSMVERRLGLIRLNGDACSKRADPFFFAFETYLLIRITRKVEYK